VLLLARLSTMEAMSLTFLQVMPASSHASRCAAADAVASSFSQPPFGRTQPLRREDSIRRTLDLSALRGTRPATSLSPLVPYPEVLSAQIQLCKVSAYVGFRIRCAIASIVAQTWWELGGSRMEKVTGEGGHF
jgi:hypothetical protein